MKFTFIIRSFAAAIISSTILFSSPVMAETIKLKASEFLPAKHGFYSDLLTSWAEELEEKTNGKVKVELFDATSAFGKVTHQADQVRAGVIDVAVGLNGIPRDRFPASSIIEMPFLVKDAGNGSKALWALYNEGLLGKEYDDFKVLGLFTHHGGLIHTIDKPVKTLGDFKGLRLRTPSPAVSAMLKKLGASPVGMPPSAIYENLQKGVLDGAVTTWDLVGAIRANETLKYHTDVAAYVAGFHVVMNKKKYNSLPEDVRKAIDEISGDALVGKFGDWWDKWDKRGHADAVKRGNTIINIDDKTRSEWEKELQPMINDYLGKMKEKGVPNSYQIYKRAKELIANFKAEG